LPKAKNAKADEALKLYRQGLKLIEISKRLEVPEGTIRRWKHSYQWDSERSEKANVRKRGAQPGNHNSSGAPPGNKRAEKYGFMSKYLPEETREIFDAIEKADPLDLLWDQIQLQYAAILRAQRIAYVKDQQDKTIEKVHEGNGTTISETWTVQQAWDKQAAFMNAQSRAMAALANLIRHYESLLQERGVRVTEEQKLRLEKMRAETDLLKRGADPDQDDGVEVINDAPPG
jgi:uncharacterized protein YjcR